MEALVLPGDSGVHWDLDINPMAKGTLCICTDHLLARIIQRKVISFTDPDCSPQFFSQRNL